MRVHRTAALLAAGLAASAFIFFASQYALHYHGEQRIGKTFQVILHDAYGAYVNATRGNSTRSFSSPYHLDFQNTILDFTNSSQNWHLPSHVSFADLTADISLDNLLKLFGGSGMHSNNGTVEPVTAVPQSQFPVPQFEKVVPEEHQTGGATIRFATGKNSNANNQNTKQGSAQQPQHPSQRQDNIAFGHKDTAIRHPAAPLPEYEPSDQQHHITMPSSAVATAKHSDHAGKHIRRCSGPADAPQSCQRSFEPTCEMYPYVRFWNQRFYSEDCYASPLRPALKEKTPYSEQKYVVFEPDWGGWNNIRMAAETVIIFAHATGRTLVMPPEMVFYLLNKNSQQDENKSTFHKFFDFRKVQESLTIISMEQFIENAAKKGLLKEPFPKDILLSQKTKLYNYIERACYIRAWEPGKWFIGFNLSSENPGIFGTFERNKATQPRYKEMVAHGRTLVPYDKQMDSERAIYFYGRYDTHRLLTHFYTYLYWEDAHTEQIYKRIVRDRLHYHDDIFCGAGRVVRKLHEDAAQWDHKPLPGPAAADPKTLGGDTNRDATYFAYHIRRGDFQYKETRLSAEKIWANTQHLLNSSVSTLIYIATDEQNHSFFAPFMQPPYRVKFLSDYEETMHEGGKVNRNHVGMMEQVICANAHTFIGTARSSFTGYITRMRGYYRDGRYERTYYASKKDMYQLQTQRPLVGPFWAREFEKASRDIDDYWQ